MNFIIAYSTNSLSDANRVMSHLSDCGNIKIFYVKRVDTVFTSLTLIMNANKDCILSKLSQVQVKDIKMLELSNESVKELEDVIVLDAKSFSEMIKQMLSSFGDMGLALMTRIAYTHGSIVHDREFKHIQDLNQRFRVFLLFYTMIM